MISYYFPPMGSGNVLRAAKFAKYFPKYGWEPHVITANPKRYYFRDQQLLDELIAGGTKIYRTHPSRTKSHLTGSKLPHLPNEASRKLFRNLKALYNFPDNNKSWISKAYKLAAEVIETKKIEIIYATAPPFSSFVVASQLKEKYKIPLIVDYRDSWLNASTNFYPTPYHRFRNRKLEQEVLRVADEVITVNRRIKEQIIEEYHYIKHDDINIISFGYDKDDYKEEPISINGPRKNKMRFTYTGTFFGLMSPKYFFEALAIVFKKRPELRNEIEACFLGILSRENLKLIKKNNLSDVIYNPGFVNHAEAIRYMRASDVLWFTIGKGEGDQMLSPVKISEYIGARKPILACVSDGAAKMMLRGYDAFKVCEPDEPASIADMIIEYYEQFKSRSIPTANEIIAEKFDIDKLTYQLVRYFEFLIDINPDFELRDKNTLKHSIGANFN